MKNWSALFDLDGVLIDTEGVYTQFWHRVDTIFPTGVHRFEYVIKGNTLGNILNTYFPDPDVRAQIVSLLRTHEENMEYCFFCGVENLLSELRDAGILTAIVTSSNKRKMERLFAQLPSLASLINTVVTEDDVQFSKPHPQGYRIAAKRLGLQSCRCIVFEDSLAGVQAGQRAGGKVVGVATTNPADTLSPFCNIVVPTLADVTLPMLENLMQ